MNVGKAKSGVDSAGSLNPRVAKRETAAIRSTNKDDANKRFKSSKTRDGRNPQLIIFAASIVVESSKTRDGRNPQQYTRGRMCGLESSKTRDGRNPQPCIAIPFHA